MCGEEKEKGVRDRVESRGCEDVEKRFFFSSRRRNTGYTGVSWARRCVLETDGVVCRATATALTVYIIACPLYTTDDADE